MPLLSDTSRKIQVVRNIWKRHPFPPCGKQGGSRLLLFCSRLGYGNRHVVHVALHGALLCHCHLPDWMGSVTYTVFESFCRMACPRSKGGDDEENVIYYINPPKNAMSIHCSFSKRTLPSKRRPYRITYTLAARPHNKGDRRTITLLRQ